MVNSNTLKSGSNKGMLIEKTAHLAPLTSCMLMEINFGKVDFLLVDPAEDIRGQTSLPIQHIQKENYLIFL